MGVIYPPWELFNQVKRSSIFAYRSLPDASHRNYRGIEYPKVLISRDVAAAAARTRMKVMMTAGAVITADTYAPQQAVSWQRRLILVHT